MSMKFAAGLFFFGCFVISALLIHGMLTNAPSPTVFAQWWLASVFFTFEGLGFYCLTKIKGE